MKPITDQQRVDILDELHDPPMNMTPAVFLYHNDQRDPDRRWVAYVVVPALPPFTAAGRWYEFDERGVEPPMTYKVSDANAEEWVGHLIAHAQRLEMDSSL